MQMLMRQRESIFIAKPRQADNQEEEEQRKQKRAARFAPIRLIPIPRNPDGDFVEDLQRHEHDDLRYRFRSGQHRAKDQIE